MKKAMKLISGFIDPSMPLGSAGKSNFQLHPLCTRRLYTGQEELLEIVTAKSNRA